MSVFELPTVTLIPNGIHHPPIEDGRLLPNSVKKKYSIIEMTREATPKEIDKCKLIYCGHGFFDEPNIQNNINKNLRD
ncbi:hypothetical protein DVY24_02885 [Enterococcus faecium]|nr:hypothetical protein DVY24_02885 [Enterococcus faecium]